MGFCKELLSLISEICSINPIVSKNFEIHNLGEGLLMIVLQSAGNNYVLAPIERFVQSAFISLFISKSFLA